MHGGANLGANAVMGHVTLFDGLNLTGSSLALGRGGHRLGVGEPRLVAFNDQARSLKVEPGFVAVVFQHADSGGGYGVSADFLEDCANLATVGLDRAVSYVSVFPAVKPSDRGTLLWRRNEKLDGQFVWGHWEFANRRPASTVPVASPPTPPNGEDPAPAHEEDRDLTAVPFIEEHTYASRSTLVTVTSASDRKAVASFHAQGKLRVRHPGRLIRRAGASYAVRMFIENTDAESTGRGKFVTTEHTLPVTLEIMTPDGQLFTANEVTMDDLRRFRDPRGVSLPWTFRVTGESGPVTVDPPETPPNQATRMLPRRARYFIGLEERIYSRSARALVLDKNLAPGSRRRYDFDLYHIGTVSVSAGDFSSGATRAVRLLDPSGATMITGDGRLSYPVTLATLRKSRGTDGTPRLWSLEVEAGPQPCRVTLHVLGEIRVPLELIQNRIDKLLGPGGAFFSISTTNTAEHIQVELEILDRFAAETIDMHSALKGLVDGPIRANVRYAIAQLPRHKTLVDNPWPAGDVDLHIFARDLKVSSINVTVGAGENAGSPNPTLKVDLRFKGFLELELDNAPDGSARIRDDQLRVEVGLELELGGGIFPVVWVQDEIIDIDGVAGFAEVIEEFVQSMIRAVIEEVAAALVGGAAHALKVLLGGEYFVFSMLINNDAIVVRYFAPREHEPRPARGYVPVQGRPFTELGAKTWRFHPQDLGDTWAVPNIANKIRHIVVVMMENRSYDHILGSIALDPHAQASDGLNPELLALIASQGFSLPQLNRLVEIPPNEYGRRTQFLGHPGHDSADVAMQLSGQLRLMAGSHRNSPSGFIENVRKKLSAGLAGRPDAVVGYYEPWDLPFFQFLTENYSFCDQFYCSHPGPTLPNRMFSLTGDVQYDRNGEAILDNNSSDEFYLSRATTVFDILERYGVPWRVYESFPSITMLRMFARYAGNNREILPLRELEHDVANRQLASVTFIDPAMHHEPQDDDHPDADMYRGQVLLKHIYDTLRKSESWSSTMLIVTYDEHGRFYDHVVPPVAEARTRGAAGRSIVIPATTTTEYGPRVPAFVVSPWTPVGRGPQIVLDHTSIAKTILARFCPDRPFLSDRVHAARTFDAYLSGRTPRLNVQGSPDLVPLPGDPKPGSSRAQTARHHQVRTEPMSRQKLATGNADSHELLGMVARMLGR